MIFQIRDSWHTFDDYIAKTKNTETNTKGTKKKQKGLRKESYL
jgi:hypothetical protein